MKNKPIDQIRRALLLGAITIMGLASAPANAQSWETWETDDSIPGTGGSLGDTIIQLHDGSLLNAFFVRGDGGSYNNDDWVVRWKPAGTEEWEDVDYWQKGGEYLGKKPRSAASYFNAANNTIEVYVVGYAYSEVEVTTGKGRKQQTSIHTQSNWAVRKGVLDNTGSWTWSESRVFWSGLGSLNLAADVAVDPDGNVYVTGWSDGSWVTEVSDDGGVNWSESDRWRLSGIDNSGGNGITIGPDGTVFVAGFGWETVVIPGSGRGRNKTPDTVVETGHWITRIMDPNTMEWSVIDDYLGPDDDNYNSFATVVKLTSTGILLVGGQSDAAADGSAGDFWTLRASIGPDYGNAWDTVDAFQPVPGIGNNYATCITEAPDGTIYVGGKMRSSDGYTSGIRSSHGLDLLNWTTEEIFPPEWRAGFLVDPIGSILVTQPDASGDSYLYVGESGPDPDGVLIRKLIP